MMLLKKNVANQYLYVYAWDAATGAPKAGDAANITAYLVMDGGAAIATNDTNPTEIDSTNMKGTYRFDLTQAETNCGIGRLQARSVTANVLIHPVDFCTVLSLYLIKRTA